MSPSNSPESDRKHLFDASAKLYSATFPWVWRLGFRKLHRWLANTFADRVNLLDAGTGSGYWARHLARADPDRAVTALDFSSEFLRHAALYCRGTQVKLVEADLTRVPVHDAGFDGILCSGVLDTFPDPLPALREFRRVLTDDGVVVLLLRGKGSHLSRALEHFFRSCVALTVILRERSWNAGHVSENEWNRTPLLGRLPGVAAAADLQIISMDSGALLSMVVLKPIESSLQGGTFTAEIDGERSP